MLWSGSVKLVKTAVDSSPDRLTCETSQALLVGGQVFFAGLSRFLPTLRLTWLKMSEIILMSHETQIKKKSNETIYRH